MDWINKDERRPKLGEKVLVFVDGDFALLTYEGVDAWVGDGCGSCRDKFITYWMPLPEKPQEETR